MFYYQRLAASQRSKLFKGTQSLNRTSESIARTHQIAAETDQIGVEIIDELGQQREQLVRTKDRVSDKDESFKDKCLFYKRSSRYELLRQAEANHINHTNH